MRPQGKPFTVQRKKSRKPRASGQTGFGLLENKPTTAETLAASGTLAAAERVFRPMVSPPDPLHPENWGLPRATLASDGLGSSRAVEQALAANRILPDLSRQDHFQETRKDETSMAAKPRRSKIRRNQRRETDAQRGQRSATRRPAMLEDSAVEAVVEKRLADLPIEPRPPKGGAGSATEPGSEGPGRSR